MSRSYQQMVFMLFRERRKRIAGILLGACIDAVTVWLGCILIFSWLDYYLPFPYLLRITLRYGCIAGGIIFFLLRGVLRVLPFPLKRMSLLIQREMRRGDEIINAYQLGMQEDQPGISQGLKDVYIQNVAEGISSSPVPRTWLKPVVIQPVTRALMMGIIAGIMYIVPPSPLKLFFPRIYGVHVAGEIYRYLQIEPGDALVPEGMPVTVRVTAVKPLPAQFVLMVKGERTSWETAVAAGPDDNAWQYHVEHLNEKIIYLIRLRDLKTREYTLTPQNIPRIITLNFDYEYPAYSGRDRVTVRDESFIRALRGTTVTITADINMPAESAALLFSDSRTVAASVPGKRIRVSFLLDREGECRLRIIGKNGEIDPDPMRIPITIQEDAVPEVKILAPDDTVMVSPDQVVPITYSVRDDFGIQAVYLVHKHMQENAEKRQRIQYFTNQITSYTGDHQWHIASLLLAPGAAIDYCIEAEDNDTLGGLKKGRSEVLRIEMVSYEKEHQRIQTELDLFREDILDILGDQMLAHESLQRVKDGWKEQDKRDIMQSLLRETRSMQDSVSARLEKAKNRMGEILPAMEKDPLGDISVYMEHAAMQKNLENLLNTHLSAIDRLLQENQFDPAYQSQEAVIAELEKIQLLSEDVMKRRAMHDVINTADSLLNKSEGILDNLENISSSPTAEQAAQLSDALRELARMMQELSSYLKDMPQELPEDFVNQEAVQSLDFKNMNDITQGLADALKRGDIEKAVALARMLAQEARSMLQTLQKAAQSSLTSRDGSGGMMSGVQESLQELEQIIIEQENLLKSTGMYDQRSRERLFKQQEKFLAELGKKQRKLLEETKRIEHELMSVSDMAVYRKTAISSSFGIIRASMESIVREFADGRVIKSQELLVDIMERLEGTANQVDILAKEAQDNVRKSNSDDEQEHLRDLSRLYQNSKKAIASVEKEEEEILRQLKDFSGREDVLSGSEMKELSDLGAAQGRLKGRTVSMTKKIKETSRQTALMGLDSFAHFDNAARAMDESSGHLDAYHPRNAVESEKKALEDLRKGKESLSEAMQALQHMMGNRGKPMAGFLQKPGAGVYPSGMSGWQEGMVHIPSKEEYVPPREFREEIMRSQKENFPAAYEEMIREYYKKVSE